MTINREARSSLLAQLLTAVVIAAAAGALSGKPWAVAALYGGLIAVANTLLQLWHMRRAERIAKEDAERILRIVYRCAAERIFSTIVLFLIGFVKLKFNPLALLVGFLATQMTVVLTKYFLKFNSD